MRAVAAETASVLLEVAAERRRQNERWGEQNHEPLAWNAILGEEAGEVAKETAESLGNRFDGPAYRRELVQTAAVAVAAIESYDRNEVPDGD